MGLMTIYLSRETEAKIISFAKEASVSKRKWINDVIGDKVSTEWSQSIKELAGAWKNFPSQ